MWERFRNLVAVVCTTGLMAACASTGGTQKAADRPIPEAPAITVVDGEVITRDVVVAQNTDGVGATWSSITENETMKAATELANLGGAPVVLGAVAGILAVDAAPRGRAGRTADALNADLDGDVLHDGLADALSGTLADDPETGARISVKEVRRGRDLPEDAWVVITEYVLAEDGSALRATARVAHAEDYRFNEMMRRQQRLGETQYYRAGSMSYNYRQLAREQERQRRLRDRARRHKPRYSNTFVYHSDMFVLPETGDMQSDDQRQRKEDRLVKALETERDARIAAAEAQYLQTTEQTEEPGKLKKAARRRDKAIKKATSLFDKSMEKARDGELDKMERLVLGMERWAGGEADGSAIAEAIEEAQTFFAEAIARELPGIGTMEVETREPTDREQARGFMVLESESDGRFVAQVIQSEGEGTIISIPEEGPASYGGQTATP